MEKYSDEIFCARESTRHYQPKFPLLSTLNKKAKKKGCKIFARGEKIVWNSDTIPSTLYTLIELSGAFDYIEKPPDLNNLLTSVRGALKSKSKIETPKSKKAIKKGRYDIVGNAKKIVELKDLLAKISPKQ